MKKLLIILLVFTACQPEKNIQAEITNVKLIGKAPIYREGKGEGCMLTWYVGSKKIEVITFEPYPCGNFRDGTNFLMLFPR